jgi:hypothetical protein
MESTPAHDRAKFSMDLASANRVSEGSASAGSGGNPGKSNRPEPCRAVLVLASDFVAGCHILNGIPRPRSPIQMN